MNKKSPNYFTSARKTFSKEIHSLSNLSKKINQKKYNEICELIINCKGNTVLMGIGKSGEVVDQKKLKIKIGNFIVAENGKISETYDEKKLKEYMQWGSIEIEINLKLGNDAFKCYTCDFTHDYIDINADYRN